MILVDSVGWIAYFTNDLLADAYEPYLLKTESLVVSTINIYEVCRRIENTAGRRAAAEVIAQMQKSIVIPVDDTIALAASSISVKCKLAMADAIIDATAQLHQAQIITSDAHFTNLPGVLYIPHHSIKSAGDHQLEESSN